MRSTVQLHFTLEPLYYFKITLDYTAYLPYIGSKSADKVVTDCILIIRTYVLEANIFFKIQVEILFVPVDVFVSTLSRMISRYFSVKTYLIWEPFILIEFGVIILFVKFI